MWNLLVPLLACTPGPTTRSTSSSGHTGTPAETGTSGGSATGSATGSTADTGTDVLVRRAVWEVDRDCWAILDTPRPAMYWQPYYDAGCNMRGSPRDFIYADTDGFCTKWEAGDFRGDCAVDDPWLLPCEAIDGCCERAYEPGTPVDDCFPNPYYEP